MNTQRLTSIDLFSGAGLLSYAFKRAGCHTVLAVEADERARRTFAANVGADEFATDAREVTTGAPCDLLVAGPPCQGFSTLGKRDASDERNELSLSVADWAESRRPSVVVVENVPQFLQSKHCASLQSRMEDLGYATARWILNAADFGAPQLRLRAFVIFSRIGLPTEPTSTVSVRATVRDAFQGLSIDTDKEGLHIAPVPGELAMARFKLIPSNGDKRDVLKAEPQLCPPSWSRLGAQATDVWGRMNMDTPANTIRCSFQNASKGRYVHPIANRVITLREGARLQGIPDEWIFCGDRSSIARQIGNGVPIHLGKAIANRIVALFRR